jgi:ring-1,2-phenylacetyl-CoA epoxidase subunit PaaD
MNVPEAPVNHGVSALESVADADARAHQAQALLARAQALLDTVADPEIPVVNLRELGILRAVELLADGPRPVVEVTLTPTYSGCPATAVIEDDVRRVLEEGGFDARLRRQLAPAWSSDWISAAGRAKLAAYGIAPPAHAAAAAEAVVPLAALGGRRAAAAVVACPRCGAAATERLAEFGSTACKALYRCRACGEPFDYFKPY